MPPISSDERYQEWLSRLEVPVEATTDIETLKDYLKDELGITGDAQVAALWDATGTKDMLAEFGISPVTVDYVTRGFKELRYAVQGMPGLWGWESVQTIIAAES